MVQYAASFRHKMILYCNPAKSVGRINCEIKRNEFLLFSIVLRILQLLITLELLVQFRWVFQQNVPLYFNRKLQMSHVRFQTDLPRLHFVLRNSDLIEMNLTHCLFLCAFTSWSSCNET